MENHKKENDTEINKLRTEIEAQNEENELTFNK
jgi:hypothetical protein